MTKMSYLIINLIISLISCQNATNSTTSNSSSNDTLNLSAGELKKQRDIINCNARDESEKNNVIDCTTISRYCCYANYTILNLTFATCFYNENEDNNPGGFFNDSIGSISDSPFMSSTIQCNSFKLEFSFFIFFLIVLLY